MIPDFKTFIKESIWGDLARRSGGTQLRGEDDINLLSGEDFLIYLQKHYRIKNKYNILIGNNNTIVCPLYMYGPLTPVFIFYMYIDNKVYISKSTLSIYTPELYELLKQNFNCHEDEHYNKHIDIDPLDEKPVTNTYFLKVLDFFIENIKDFRDEHRNIRCEQIVYKKSED